MSSFGSLNINAPPGANVMIGTGHTMNVGSGGPARDTDAGVLDPLFARLDAMPADELAALYRDASLRPGVTRCIPPQHTDTDILLAYAARRMQRA